MDSLGHDFWNNAKGLLSFVVMGSHFVLLSEGMVCSGRVSGGFVGRLISPVVNVSTLVSMPGFCFITGKFSSVKPGREAARSQVSIFACWIFTHLIWMPLNHDSTQDGYFPNSARHFFGFFNYDWYLLVLLVWRTMLPILAEIEPSVLAVGSMALAIASLFLDWSEVANEQLVFSFLPFFLAGFHCKKIDGCLHQWRQRRWPFWVGMMGIVLISGISFIYKPFTENLTRVFVCQYGGRPRDTLFGCTTDLRHAVDCRAPHKVVQILGLYAMSSVGFALFLAMVPDRRVPLVTKAGENSLYMYMLHYYVVHLFATLTINFDPNIRTALAISVWFACFAFLAHGRVNKLFRLCIEPPVDFLMRTEGARPQDPV